MNFWHNYGGPQYQFSPQDLVPYSRYNYGTGTTLSGSVPNFDAWAKASGNISGGEGQDPHDAYEQAMAMGLMSPQQFNANIDRNRPRSGFLDKAVGGIIDVAAGGLPVFEAANAAGGSDPALQYANTQGSNPLAALLPLLMAGGLFGQQPQRKGILGNVSPDEGMGGPIAQTNLQRIAMMGG